MANRHWPLEHLAHVGALGPQTLVAHSRPVTPPELGLPRDNGTAVAYNLVASLWKGNAIAPAGMMAVLAIRFGLGTDGTRADGFRLMDAAEGMQRASFGFATGDSSCGGGWLWLDAATRGAADAAGLSRVTDSIAQGRAADSHDLTWELVRYGNRDRIDAAFTDGRLRLWKGWPVDGDARPDARDPRDPRPRHRRHADPAHPPGGRGLPPTGAGPVSAEVFAIRAAAVLASSFVQGSIGIGFALIVAPMAGVMAPSLLPVTVLLLMLPLNALVAWRERHAVDWPGVR